MRATLLPALGLALGVVLSRSGLAGPEGLLRGLDGAAPGLLILGALLLLVRSWPRPQRPASWPLQLLGGALFGVGVALTGAVPITLAAGLGEGRVLALLVLGGVWMGWRLGGHLDPEASHQERASSSSSESS